MAVGPDRLHPAAAGERVVPRHAAIAEHPDHLAIGGGQILRQHALLGGRMLARGDPGIRPVDHDARPVMHVIARRRILDEDVRHLGQLRPILRQPSPCRRRDGAAPDRLGIGPVDHAVLGEIGRDRHVEEAALPAVVDLGDAGDGARQAALGRHHPHRARPLCHKPVAPRQRGDAPRIVQPLGEGRHRHRRRGQGRRPRLVLEGGGEIGVRLALRDALGKGGQRGKGEGGDRDLSHRGSSTAASLEIAQRAASATVSSGSAVSGRAASASARSPELPMA